MGKKEWEPASVFDVFGDSLARQILVIASEQSVSADTLADQLDASLPTVYRRVNALQEYDLITERIEIGSEGNQYKTFETTLKRIEFEINNGGFNIDIQMRQNLLNQFEAFWSELEHSSASGSQETTDPSGHPSPNEDPHHG